MKEENRFGGFLPFLLSIIHYLLSIIRGRIWNTTLRRGTVQTVGDGAFDVPQTPPLRWGTVQTVGDGAFDVPQDASSTASGPPSPTGEGKGR